eukprot:11343159-Alexandrium_andersonii.AAC.1
MRLRCPAGPEGEARPSRAMLALPPPEWRAPRKPGARARGGRRRAASWSMMTGSWSRFGDLGAGLHAAP